MSSSPRRASLAQRLKEARSQLDITGMSAAELKRALDMRGTDSRRETSQCAGTHYPTRLKCLKRERRAAERQYHRRLGIDHRGLLEKSELVEQLEQDIADEENMGVIAQSRVDELAPAERSVVETFERCSPSVVFIQTTAIGNKQALNLHSYTDSQICMSVGVLLLFRASVPTKFSTRRCWRAKQCHCRRHRLYRGHYR